MLYWVFRFGICCQLMTLCITVLTWADFLHYGRYIHRLWYIPKTRGRSFWLRVSLLCINVIAVLFSVAIILVVYVIDPMNSVQGHNGNQVRLSYGGEWGDVSIARSGVHVT